MVFVAVQRRHSTRQFPDNIAAQRDDFQQPNRSFQPQTPRISEFFLNQVAERRRLIDTAVAQEITPTRFAVLEGEENGLHHVFHIDKREVLLLVADREIHVSPNRLRHHKIILFARAIDTRRTQNHVWKSLFFAFFLQKFLRQEFALTVGRVRMRLVGLDDFRVGLLLANWSENAQRTQIDEAFQRHFHPQKNLRQQHRSPRIHEEKLVVVGRFREAGGVYDIVEAMAFQLLLKPLLRVQVQLDETDALVLQKLARTALANSRPHLVASRQSLFDDETADKTAGSGDKNFQLFHLPAKLRLFRKKICRISEKSIFLQHKNLKKAR